MRKCIFFFSFFTFYFLLFTSSLAQLSKGGKPLSFNENYQLKKNVPTEVMPSVDVEKLKAEDSINAQDKSIPWRFGHNFDVNLNLQNSGLWETLPHGDRIWRLKIISHDALSINLQFDDYWLPEGAKLFIYNESKSEIIGAFTDLNNKSFRKLGTTPVHGDKIILEYFEPKKAAGLGTLNISTVTHAYRDIFSLAKGLGDSGPCNNNVVCPEGDNWRDQIRSVAIIIVGGNSGCTGALINNSCEDGTPYFLTANHCLGGSTSTWVFRFHWDSPTCSSTGNGPTNYTISGATLMASNGGSDFALLELSTQIPDSFNVFYAGWDRSGTNPTSQTAIHHPSGDVKKISFDYDPAVSTTWSSAQVWEITQWEDGTTEPGSSGSPLFDQDGRIIGQLFGGGASCGNITDDNYGRVNVSWDNDPTPSKQLKYWLANCDTSVQEIDGYDPNAQSVANDAAAHSVLDIQPLLCGNTIQPKIIFKNKGLDTLISLTIVYDLDGNVLDSVLWSGTLAPNTTDTVSVPIISIANDGSHTFTATVKNPNNSVDSNAVNDSKTVSFYAITNSTDVSFTLNLDDWGSEISWSITDTTGIIVHSGGGYADNPGGETITDTLCLSKNACYTFTIDDSFGDGLSEPNGSYLLQDANGDTLASIINVNFGNQEINTFCAIDSSVSITENANKKDFVIYPNPGSGIFNLRFPMYGLRLEKTGISIYNVLGEKVYSNSEFKVLNSEINLSSQPKGIYFIEVKTPGWSIVKKLVLSD